MARELPPGLAAIARSELHEDPELIQSSLQHIRDWVSKQSHLKINTADQWLLAFLRGSKYNMDRCKTKLDMYYTLRSIVPELYYNRDPFDDKIQKILKNGTFLPLLNTTAEDATRKVLVRYDAGDTGDVMLTDLIKVSLMIAEILLLEDDNFVVAGETAVVDMSAVGWGLLRQWTPALAKKVISCMETGMPVRVKAVHILNTSASFQLVFYIFKLFISGKLKKRVFVYGRGSEDVRKHIPTSILPAEYGGSDGTLQQLTDHWKTKVESYRSWFLREETAKSDESKRPRH